MGQYWDPIEASKRDLPLTPNMRRDGLTHHIDTSYQASVRPPSSRKGTEGQFEIDLPTFMEIVPQDHRSLAEEHSFGNPFTTPLDDIQVSLSSIEFAYVVWRLRRWLKPNVRVLEIGGGYGGLTCVLHRHRPSMQLTVVDLEPMLDIQEYYLRNTIGHSVTLQPSIAGVMDLSFDVIIATRILCELDIDETNTYLQSISDHLKPGGVFYCVHHWECINNFRDWRIPMWDLVDERSFPFQVHKRWLEKLWMKERKS